MGPDLKNLKTVAVIFVDHDLARCFQGAIKDLPFGQRVLLLTIREVQITLPRNAIRSQLSMNLYWWGWNGPNH